jgi:protein-S-isoprenylcysteine O-methyltransferase Ste14
LSLLIQSDHAARDVVVGLVAAAAVAEVAATYLGQAREGHRRLGASVAEAVLLTRRRDAAQAADRGTKQILVVAVLVGLVAAVGVARVPALRSFANTWWTLTIGATVMLSGIVLRSWSIWTLGRHFRREVTVEADHG